MDYIYLNQIAQDIVHMDVALKVFRELSQEQRSETIHRLGTMTCQAQPTRTEVDDAISAAHLKSTFSPCMMLASANLNRQVSRLWQLPDDELDKAFALLIHLFRIADKRRRDSCGQKCDHWWHRDLSQDYIVQELRTSKDY